MSFAFVVKQVYQESGRSFTVPGQAASAAFEVEVLSRQAVLPSLQAAVRMALAAVRMRLGYFRMALATVRLRLDYFRMALSVTCSQV